jgi:hypothetical protein
MSAFDRLVALKQRGSLIESALSVYLMDRVPSYLPGLPSTRKKYELSFQTRLSKFPAGLAAASMRSYFLSLWEIPPTRHVLIVVVLGLS